MKYGKTKNRKTKNKRQNKKNKTQKKKHVWNMKGCRGKRVTQKGGFSQITPGILGQVSPPTGQLSPPLNNAILVGNSWSGNPTTWPGTSTNAGNHDSLNTYQNQVDRLYENEAWNSPTASSRLAAPLSLPKQIQTGGKKHKKHTKKIKKNKKLRGGFSLGTSVFDQMGSDLTNAYRTWKGQDPVVSPLPFQDQIYYGPRAENNINSIIL